MGQRRTGVLLLGVLAFVVVALCAVTWAGVLTLDATRSLVRSEARYVSAWGLAFGHLDGFVRSSDVREYAKFEQDLLVPLASMAARQAMADPAADPAEVHRLLVRTGVDPADARTVIRLHRLWGETPVGARYLAERAAVDREVLALRDLGLQLRRTVATAPLDSAQVAAALRALGHAEREMERHSYIIDTLAGATARQVRDVVLASLFVASLLILALAGALVFRLLRGIARSEGRFRATFENAAVGIAHTATDGTWLRVNDRLCAMLGYAREELLAHTFQEITPPDDLEANLVLFHEALAGVRDTYQMEKRLRRRDGHLVWVNLTASLLRTPAGDPLYFISVLEDISERKCAEAALRRSEQQLEEALEAGRVFAYDLDPRTDTVTRSANAADILGELPAETEASAAAFLQALHPEDRPALEAVPGALSPAQPAFAVRVRYRRPDGATVVLEDTGRGFFDETGRLVRIAGLATDVTDRARVEEALRESETRFRQIAENLDGALWMLDAGTGRMLYTSPAAERLWGLPLDVIRQGRAAVLARVHEEDRPRVAAVLAGPVTDRASVDFRLGADSGDTRWLRSSVFPIRDGDGAAYRIGGYTEDITESMRYREEREARARAEDALRVKTAILRGVSEELRTPLTSILGFTALLKEGPIPSEAAEYAAIVERNARRLEEAFSGILDLAQVESGAVELRPEAVDVGVEAQEAAALLRPAARARGLDLVVEVAGPTPRGLADRGALQRILRSLIGAGLAATERGGVHLHVHATAAEVELRVRDTGAGFDADVLPYLFSGFHDAGWARDRSSVELALAKRLAEVLGGSLGVESVPGEGTTFTLRLPRAPEPGVAEGDGAAVAAVPG